MNTVKINIRKRHDFKLCISVDGKTIPLKKGKSDDQTAIFETEKDKINVKIFTLPNELTGKLWFLRFLFYYIISFFGLFDWMYSKCPYGICYEADYIINGDIEMNLFWKPSAENKMALYAKDEDSPFIDNESNVFTYDKKIKRRFVGVIVFKIVSWIAIAALILTLVIL